MLRNRFKLFSVMALSLFLSAFAAAQGGQFQIVHAEFGNERNHADVTPRLRELARSGQPIVVNPQNLGFDPAPGEIKVLRVIARSPDGQTRNFDYPENTALNGAQFMGFNRGEWGNERWEGGWNGGGPGGEMRGHQDGEMRGGRQDGEMREGRQGGEMRDNGRFVILSAQYGSRRHHVDVTNQLKQLARADVRVRINYRTFGVDPDEGHSKTLRIFARGPGGRERMFDYRDNSVIDGSQFRGWSRGEWAGPEDRWSGRWDIR